MQVVFPTAFLPSVSYFAFFSKADEALLDVSEHYQKQTIRSRCQIRTSQKTQTLTVPVKASSKYRPISESLIDQSVLWQKDVLRSIQTAYGKSPFFEYYFDDFHPVINHRYDKLVDLNMALLTICLKCLKLYKPISHVYEYKPKYEGHYDLRNDQIYDQIQLRPYVQVFGNVFVPNLSIIDLLFCEGPNATNVLNLSIINTIREA